MLLLTLGWPHHHCRLGILFAGLIIPPSAPASSCMPFLPLNTNFSCLLADPLGFEDPPTGVPVAEQTHRWLAMLAVTACFLRSMCPALSPATPPHPPAHTCSTPRTAGTATTLDSLVGPPAAVTFVLLGSAAMSPQQPPRPHISCCSPQVSSTPGQISNDEVPTSRLRGTSPPQPSAHAAAPSSANSDDEVPIPCFCSGFMFWRC
jgi:hypothetical protein